MPYGSNKIYTIMRILQDMRTPKNINGRFY